MQLSFLNEWLRISDCDVLDVGANIGQSFHPLVRDKTKIRYFAFEPVTAIYIQLAARLAETRNESVHAFPIHRAISDTDGFCSIWHTVQEGYSESATIIAELSNSDRMGTRVYRSEVECQRLDSFCNLHRLAPRVIKIDVEGAEHKVVMGGLLTIATFQPVLYLEVGGGNHRDLDLLSYLSQLEFMGYHLRVANIARYRSKWIRGHEFGDGKVWFDFSWDKFVSMNASTEDFLFNVVAYKPHHDVNPDLQPTTLPLEGAFRLYDQTPSLFVA